MSNSRAATRLAIILGAGVGALAAFMGGAPRRSEAPAPAEPAPAAKPVQPAPARPERTVAVPPQSAPKAPPPTQKPEPSELDAPPVAELEKRCALRQARGCLASARAFELGRGVPADPAKARLYRSLAVSLLDERCLSRDPESCSDLAELYSIGAGVVKNEATASALTERARELCKGKTTSFCEKLSAK